MRGRQPHRIQLVSREHMPTKPKLGQNFLNDADAVERIAAALGDVSGRTVVEIGPGGGAITGALAARAKHVIAVEYDRELAEGLLPALVVPGLRFCYYK